MPSSRPVLHSLTSLRFFAASLIVLHHSKGLFGVDGDLSEIFPTYQAVSFFFVLSGFILTYVYPSFRTNGSLKKFYLSRLARVWPLHAATLVLAIVFFSEHYRYLATNNSRTALLFYTSFASNIFLVHGWIPIKDYHWSFNAVSWSISTEFAFYLLFPLLVANLNKTWKIKLAGTFAVSVIAVLAMRFFDLSTVENAESRLIGVINVNPLSRLFEFSMGMTAAVFYERVKDCYRPGMFKGTAVEFVLLAAVFAGMSLNGFYKSVFESVLGPAGASWVDNGVLNSLWFAMLILCFSVHRGAISKCLSARFFVLLGEISFSIYLLHQIMVRIYIARVEPLDSFSPVFSFVYFWAILLVGSYVFWHTVEIPARRAILMIAGKRRPDDGGEWKPFDGGLWKTTCTLAIFAVLVTPVVAFVKNTPAIREIEQPEAEAIVRGIPEQYRNVGFGENFVLVGADFVETDGKRFLRLVWKAARDAVLEKKVAVHFIDREGTIVGNGDYFQSRKENISTPVSRNTIWVDEISVPEKIQGRIRRVGVCIYENDELLKIEKGPRDWNERRFLVDFPFSSQGNGDTG